MSKRQKTQQTCQRENGEMLLFWHAPSVFSQWYPCEFNVGGQKYTSAEQYMMAEKALLFGDLETRHAILSTNNTKQQKALGRKVKGFSEQTWKDKRYDVVFAGNLAKFCQNPSLGQALIATGSKILAEASWNDKIWGIGLHIENDDCWDQKLWKGKNLLGKVLMEVREYLI